MRHFLLLAFLFSLIGCSKKPEPAPDEGDPQADPAPAGPELDTIEGSRAHWLKQLQSTDPKKREDAATELAVWVETDPEAVAELLELLRDPTDAQRGRVRLDRISSTREAAALALALGGPNGGEALNDKGLSILRDELKNQDATIRQHTLHTIGELGQFAQSLSPDLLPHCEDDDADVRGMAFRTLERIGITDPVAFAALLRSDVPNVPRLTAEILPALPDVPATAVPHLIVGLRNEDDATIRTGSAAALANVGTAAAPAVESLIAAIKLTYPEEAPDGYFPGAEEAFWRALAAIGKPAVSPTAGLLSHPNQFVRAYAVQTLGDIGPPAKTVAKQLLAAMSDMDETGLVRIEAACALGRIGESTDEAAELMKVAMNSDGVAASYAIDALSRMGDAGQKLIPEALTKLESNNPNARFAAVGLVGTLEPAEATKHVAALGTLAKDPEIVIRRRVGEVLERLEKVAAPAAKSVGEALEAESDLVTRYQFVDALIAMGPGAKPALAALVKQAQQPTPEVARRARLFEAIVVADPSDDSVAEVLLTELSHPDAGMRVAAARATAKLDPMPADGLTKLVNMAKTERSTPAKIAALQALAVAGEKAKPVRAEVEAIAAGKYPEFALLGKVALAAIDGNVNSAAADVRAGLSHRNSQVRAAAVGALLLIGPEPADVPALQKLLTDRYQSATREAAAKCAAQLGEQAKEAVPQLIDLLDDRDGDVRAAAAMALGEMGEAARPAIEKLKELRGEGQFGDVEAGGAAAKALRKLGVKSR